MGTLSNRKDPDEMPQSNHVQFLAYLTIIIQKDSKQNTFDTSEQFIIYKTNTSSQTFLPNIKVDKPWIIKQYIRDDGLCKIIS